MQKPGKTPPKKTNQVKESPDSVGFVRNALKKVEFPAHSWISGSVGCPKFWVCSGWTQNRAKSWSENCNKNDVSFKQKWKDPHKFSKETESIIK